MKMNIKTMGLVAAVLFTSTLSFGQKKNVTNAAIQRKAHVNMPIQKMARRRFGWKETSTHWLQV